ncbi:MAG: NAD-dependent epimerase/dehydratase family protein [Gemmatimonadales bacterium]
MLTEAQLDDALSTPSAADVAAMAALPGDLLILGASGKMGPSLARLAHRASRQAGTPRRIIGAARFSQGGVRPALEQDGIETISCDLLDRAAVEGLPDCPNVIFMVGQKFGTTGNQALTWAVNTQIPALVADRFRGARIVAFSTGNVYPLVQVGRAGRRPERSEGSTEQDTPAPVGEYAQSALARERVLQDCSRRNGTPMAILRLNYAVELRYGVLRDLADAIAARRPIPLAMGHVNVIWQRDANSVALRALAHCASPPLVLNVTGPENLAVRAIARRLGRRLGIEPEFLGTEGDTALLSDAGVCRALFGPPLVSADQAADWVAGWVKAGGPSLGKPTHFEVQTGEF